MEILGIRIIAGQKMRELRRGIRKVWKLDFAIQATFAKSDVIDSRPAEALILPMQSTTGRAGYIHSTQIGDWPTVIERLTCNGICHRLNRGW